MKTPIIFFGSSSYVIPVIEYLNEAFDLKLVITTEKDTGAVPQYCQRHAIPYRWISSTKGLLATSYLLQTTKSPFAVLADFGLIIPQSVLDLFPQGIINIHPSLLPEYRGPTPGVSALLDGKTTTGISIMLLDKDLDHGPLIGQMTTTIKPNDTAATLYPRLFEEATTLLKNILPDYFQGKMQPKEQDHTKATFTQPHLTRESGFVEYSELTKTDPIVFDRKIRAFYPWPSLWTKYTHEGRLKGKIIKFLPNTTLASEAWQSLPLKEKMLLQVEGKKPVSIKDFLNGYPEAKEWIEKIGVIARSMTQKLD